MSLMRWIAAQLQEVSKQSERVIAEIRFELTETDSRLANLISVVRSDFIEADERRDRAQNDYRHQQAQQVQTAMGDLRRDLTTALNRVEDRFMQELRDLGHEHP
ncbi:MAG: hypothetical protein JOZ58_18460 [Acetobacteraceae bacterium]|nr:hypothetical protein [Acetobacteraceae bacterium]